MRVVISGRLVEVIIVVQQSSILEPMLFSTFIKALDSGTEFTLSKFADDTTWRGVVETLGICAAIQRNLDRGSLWSSAKGKYGVLHLSVHAGG